jgi:uncharacterized membrane-anchored protein
MRSLILILLLFHQQYALADSDSLLIAAMDSIENEYQFKKGNPIPIEAYGKVNLKNNFKFLDKKQTNDFVSKYWGILSDEVSYLGLILENNKSIFDTSALLFTIYYLPNLLVHDEEFEVLEDSRLLKQLKHINDSVNIEKIKIGATPLKVLDWLVKPTYVMESNCVYWAEQIESESGNKQVSAHLRFIGKEGVMAFDCVSSWNSSKKMIEELKKLHNIFSFNESLKYNKNFKSNAHKSIEFLVIGTTLGQTPFEMFFSKYWKALFFILGIGGVILFFQYRTTKL